jgi:hypothetical protein
MIIFYVVLGIIVIILAMSFSSSLRHKVQNTQSAVTAQSNSLTNSITGLESAIASLANIISAEKINLANLKVSLTDCIKQKINLGGK